MRRWNLAVRWVMVGVMVALLALPGAGAEPEGGARENRLAKETSPYLLGHAKNPVDWYPWGEEALERAKREKKPIFLSVGYSSCYWCHVMERESFMDAEIAAYLNEHFVCIKVDREERPDIDEIYMTSVQVYHQLAGAPQGGGWPMSVFLTPDALPFFGASYFPPRDQEGRTGFLTVAKRVEQIWRENPERVTASAKAIAELVAEALVKRPTLAELPKGDALLKEVQAALAEQFDAEYGGFGFSVATPNRPKFPEPMNLLFLAERGEDAEARKMLQETLDAIARGGIRDHIGGGFHRYSVDRRWEIPHFEKMLYDNAQLVSAYSRTYALTKDEAYRAAAEEALAFVAREMTAPDGGFYSALDAETAAGEGFYYSWTREELAAALTAEELTLVGAVYGFDGAPNFEERYVPRLAKPRAEVAVGLGLSVDVLEGKLTPIRAKLLVERGKRARPLCDTKIITAWNGLMIGALAEAGRVFENAEYLDRARRAAEFALQKLRQPDGRLWHVSAAGEAKLNAYLDDYAYLIAGLLELHRATREEKWLDAAVELSEKQQELFWDKEHGGYFFTSHDHETLIAKSKDPVDGVLPAANGVAARNWVRLWKVRARPEYLERAEGTLKAFTGYLVQYPGGMPGMALGVRELELARE
jgi:uncharacterized protein YyaL (SSP411 family)